MSPLFLDVLYTRLVAAYSAVGDIDAAEAAYRRRVDLNPTDPLLHNNLSHFLLEQAGDAKGAIDEARAALRLMDFGMAHANLSAALAERGNAKLWGHEDVDDAIRDFDDAIKAYPQNHRGYYGRAAAFRKQALLDHRPELVQKARADLKKVLVVEPGWQLAKGALAELETVKTFAKSPED